MEKVKATYGDAIKDLQPLKISRPPKPAEKPAAKAEDKPKEPAATEAPAPAAAPAVEASA